MRINYKWCIIKSAVFPFFFLIFDLWSALSLSIMTLLLYRHVIALCLNLQVMPALDFSTFLGNEKQIPNVMSAIKLERVSAEVARNRFRSMMTKIPKMKYSIVEVMGDLYYREMSEEEAIEKIFIIMKKEDEVNNDQEID